MGASSTVIALTALIFTIRESRRNQKLAELSVRPLVAFNYNDYPDGPLFDFVGIEIENVGQGPAYVTPLHFFLDGTFLGTNERTEQPRLAQAFSEVTVLWLIHNCYCLRPNEKRKVITLNLSQANHDQISGFLDVLGRLNVTVCYLSAFGDSLGTSLRGYDDPDRLQKELKKRCNTGKRVKMDFG